MVDIFIKQTKSFIEKSGLKLKYHSAHLNSRAIISSNRQDIQVFLSGSTVSRTYQEFLENYILQISTLFLLFDVYLDSQDTNIVGESYAKKYQKLSCDDDIEIIQKEIYGILKIFRNALTHGMEAIIFDGNLISIDRINKYNKREKLELNFDSLENIFTAVIMIIEGIKNYREECYLKYFYQKIISQVKFIDDKRNIFLDLNDSFNLMCVRLESQLDTDLCYIDNERIEVKHQKREDDKNLYDYIIEINGVQYMIPEELLQDKKILIRDIQKWKI